jgi:CRAL/TRIO domain
MKCARYLLSNNLIKEQMIYRIFMVPLPKTATDTSPRVIFFAGMNFEPTAYKVEDIMKVATMIFDLMMEEDDQMIISGQIQISDMKNATVAHMLQWSPQMMKKMSVFTQEGSPFRIKAAHHINSPAFLEKFVNFFKQFLNEKMKSRVRNSHKLNFYCLQSF